jgi:hypothetical protein
VSLCVIGDVGRDAMLRRETEDALTDAAPDLDEIAIEWVDAVAGHPTGAPG